MPKKPLFSEAQIAAALHLYDTIGSMPKVVKLLGYPSVPTLSYWIRKYPELRKPRKATTYKHAPIELKLEAIHRCTECGETIKSVSEDIGYTTVAIWGWIRKYSEKGTVSLMSRSDTSIPSDLEKIRSAEDIETPKGPDAGYADGDRYPEGNHQRPKKRPRRQSGSPDKQGEGSDN